MKAVSTYGPTAVKNRVAAGKTLDKLEIGWQSIRNPASAYSRFRDAWTGATAPPIEAILADTSHLESVCRS